jgi:predicted  nucleic acid-binding Zn-ribbon protein
VQTNETLASLTDQRTDAVDNLQRQRQLVVGSTTDLQAEQERLQRRRDDLQTAKAAIQRKLGEAQHELDRLTGDQQAQLAAADEKDTVTRCSPTV